MILKHPVYFFSLARKHSKKVRKFFLKFFDKYFTIQFYLNKHKSTIFLFQLSCLLDKFLTIERVKFESQFKCIVLIRKQICCEIQTQSYILEIIFTGKCIKLGIDFYFKLKESNNVLISF